SGLATQFGMAELVGKPLATISDARLNTKSDSTLAVERLLSISGEDVVSVPRKFKPDWIGRLSTRFLILTNELPQLSDASGTIAGRFVILTMTRSFYDEEDPELTTKLVAEAPGIFNWALEGLDRLTDRGHFKQPPASAAALCRRWVVRRTRGAAWPLASVRRAEYRPARVDSAHAPSERCDRMRAASGPAAESLCSGAFALSERRRHERHSHRDRHARPSSRHGSPRRG
ncbi:MAG: DUF5906 domain-containing protein, partial [Gaiellaceae bacterium]